MSRFACKTVSLGGGTSTRLRPHLNPRVALVVAPLATWTTSKSPPTVSGLYFVKNA